MKDIKESVLRLQSIFNFIKTAAEANQSECEKFCWELIPMAELGYEIAYEIWKESESNSETPDSIKAIAEKISFLIKSEDVPQEISDALLDGIADALNASKQQEVLEYEQSPEFIAKVLRDYKR